MDMNRKRSRFENQLPTPMNPEGTSIWKAMGKMIRGVPGRRPDEPIETVAVKREKLEEQEKDLFVSLGHSSLYLQLNKVKILVDPLLSKYASPFNFTGPKAFDYTNPISIDDFPDPDIVLITHDHYDHLDRAAIKTLKNRAGIFLCPVKVGKILNRWGIDSKVITELKWGEQYNYKDNLEIISTPARHFSGRGMFNRMSTLWSSYVLRTPEKAIFCGGDSGYGPHFKDIGNDYGPFEQSFLECGQYNENWPLIHMMPEETVQAAIDLKTKAFTPIHWGKFALSLHPWEEPIERAKKESSRLKQEISIPIFGSTNYF
jgi:L-ascorbate metabolism protein UlaG (beta-lactamase superfamily)